VIGRTLQGNLVIRRLVGILVIAIGAYYLLSGLR
jgi:hypothetical protein